MKSLNLRSTSRFLLVILVALLAIAFLIGHPGPVKASPTATYTFVVDSPVDSPHKIGAIAPLCQDQEVPVKCSLRAAIEEADLPPVPGDKFIITVPGWTFTLAPSLGTLHLALGSDVTISGAAGSPSTVIDASGGAFTVVGVDAGNTQASLNQLIIQGSNTPTTNGGGIYNAGTLALNNSSVSNNTSNNGGGIYNQGTLIVRSSLFHNNSATNGGGIYNNYKLTVTGNSTLSGNTATSGGGIYNRGVATVDNSWVISGNTASGNGGGIYNHGTVKVINSSQVGGNMAAYGGGIYNQGPGGTTVKTSDVSNNTATYEGGGIFNQDGTIYVHNQSTLTGNQASFTGGAGGNGGGIYNNGGNTDVSHSTISSNTATNGKGGGIYDSGGGVAISKSRVSNNHATDGGGIYLDASGEVDVITGTINGNIAANTGAGIETIGGRVNLKNNSHVSTNIAGGNGGGIYNGDGNVTVDSSVFSYNSTTSGSGGGISADGQGSGATTTITNSTFSNNTAPNASGGGIDSIKETLIVTASTFSSNSAVAGAGIFSNMGGTVTVTNTTISGNSTVSYGFGGGLYNGDGTLNVNTSTVSGNSSNQGGGIYENWGSTTVSNSTVAGNSGPSAGNIFNDPGAPGTVTVTGTIVANSLVGPNCSGTITSNDYNLEYTLNNNANTCNFHQLHDQSQNPMLGPLKDNGGPTWTMALPDPSQGPSPAVDTGSTSCPLNDQRGKARPDDGAGTACDIGAYEFSGDGGGCLPHSGTSQVAQSNVHTHGALPHTGSPQAPQGNLVYHGGAVMCGTVNAYAIFWEPTGSYVSPTYNSLIMQYFGDVGGSGLYHNNTQYPDSQGNAPQNAVLGGSWVDTHAYPSNPISDAQVQQEVTHAQSVNGWTSNTLNIFFVFTAKGENICSSFGCSFQAFCAYHGFFGSNSIYAAMPYTGTDLSVCGVPTSPNNDIDADSTINVTSHEQIEAATDPMLNAWYDASGSEIGDKCAWTFGPGNGDVTWNGHMYEVQKEWDNHVSGCVLSGP